ncbi:uncharacterized protein LOC115886823 [Sitophilus oryzae]|uniref:Uncharacterized protein LOC115886823 n=1 Tax=Sitophilus oryzae TaxID=7048 RepID=A0A6J2YF64_SITOR|nr:uncharacterized protein LOC115886823 [Sitophilus oryzae]
MKVLISLIVLVSFSSISYGAYNSYYDKHSNSNNGQEQLEWSDYRYSISAGSCSGRKLVEEDVQKNADPFTIKKSTYSWLGRGMFVITCIKVNNQMPRDRDAGEARIIEGGVGQGSVKIEMTSKNSKGLYFTVEIWGQETSQSSGIAVLSNTPQKILYMGGKKYCEC